MGVIVFAGIMFAVSDDRTPIESWMVSDLGVRLGAGRSRDPQAVVNISNRQALKIFLHTHAVYHKILLHPKY